MVVDLNMEVGHTVRQVLSGANQNPGRQTWHAVEDNVVWHPNKVSALGTHLPLWAVVAVGHYCTQVPLLIKNDELAQARQMEALMH